MKIYSWKTCASCGQPTNGLHFQFEFHITVLRCMERFSVKQFVTNCNIKNMRFFLCTAYIVRIQRRSSRLFTISSQRRELSPTRTSKWSGRNRVQITCNTSSANHVQHVVLRATWYKGTAQICIVCTGTNLHHLYWHKSALFKLAQICIICIGTNLHHLYWYKFASFVLVEICIVCIGRNLHHLYWYKSASFVLVQICIVCTGTNLHRLYWYKMHRLSWYKMHRLFWCKSASYTYQLFVHFPMNKNRECKLNILFL